MSKLKNGEILVGTHGADKRKGSWIYADGVAHALNPLCKTVPVGAKDKLPLQRHSQYIDKITDNIDEVREYSVPFYTSL